MKSALAVEDFQPLSEPARSNKALSGPALSGPALSDTTGRKRPERLRLLDIEQMAMTLAFLAGYRPPVFGSVLDGPEPHCTACGGEVGIFLGHGTDWHHFRAGAADGGPVEIYVAEHAPVIGWRYPATVTAR